MLADSQHSSFTSPNVFSLESVCFRSEVGWETSGAPWRRMFMVKPSSTLWGSWAQKPFHVPHFLQGIDSVTFHEFWRAANQGREGIQRQGRRSQETAVQPCSQGLVSPQGIRIIIFLSCLADTETPTRLEKLTVCFPQVHWPPVGLNPKVDDSDSLLPHYQPFRRMFMS